MSRLAASFFLALALHAHLPADAGSTTAAEAAQQSPAPASSEPAGAFHVAAAASGTLLAQAPAAATSNATTEQTSRNPTEASLLSMLGVAVVVVLFVSLRRRPER